MGWGFLAPVIGSVAGKMLGRGGRSRGGSDGGSGRGGTGGGIDPALSRQAANLAMPYLEKIPAIGKEMYNPFINQGRTAQAETDPIYSNMTRDPAEFMNQLMSRYSPSEGYQFKRDELTRAMQNSAAQGGYAGTPFAQKQQANLTRALMSQDMQEFLSNVLGIQSQGLQGRERDTMRGFQASSSLADYLGDNLGAQSRLKYAGETGHNLLAQGNALRDSQDRYNRRMDNSKMWSQAIGGAADAIFNPKTY